MVIDIDDEDSQRLLRLFNTAGGPDVPQGRAQVSADELIEKLTWLGISGIANVLCCIKMAKYYELTERRCRRHRSDRLRRDVRQPHRGAQRDARRLQPQRRPVLDHNLHMLGLKTDSMMELNVRGPQAHPQPQVLHLGRAAGARPVEELNALWYDTQGHVGRRPRPGEGARRAHQRVQRGHRPSQSALRDAKGDAGTPCSKPC